LFSHQDHLAALPDVMKPYFDFIWSTPNISELQSLKVPGLHFRLQELKLTLDSLHAEEFQTEKIAAILKSFDLGKNLKFSDFMKILRVAMSGNKTGPSVAEMMWVIGKTQTLIRLDYAIQECQSE
jgi:glutamyl/glutaminyl-tRNA synthetase